MANRYWATGRGGTSVGFIDQIDPTDTDGSSTALAAGDVCTVIEEDFISEYIARESAGATEHFPDIIIPNSNAGDFWWELVEEIPQQTGMVTQLLYENMPGAF